jgi:phytoene desaturase
MAKADVITVGAGFAGLSAATNLAYSGKSVILLEKNNQMGGRARSFQAEGFTFDMGPSWYWMPDVFESYFSVFGKQVSDFYDLVRLDPSYRIFFGENDYIDVPANYDELRNLFNAHEPGSADRLDHFMKEAEYKYKVGMSDFVFKPGHSLTEFIDTRVFRSVFRLQMLTSLSKHVESLFKDEKLRQLLKFPVLFLGSTPEDTPALYSLMNYADLKMGTWYPMGGMHKIVEAMEQVARDAGVEMLPNHEVNRFEVPNGHVNEIITDQGAYSSKFVVAAGDYHHMEQRLLPEKSRAYNDDYWQKRTMAPSSLLFYLGVDKKLDNLHHHNLFFDEDFNQHAREIYQDPQWPQSPLFYVCCSSKTDPSVAPEGKENVFILIPVAPGLEDSEDLREKYYNIVMERLEKLTGQKVKEHVTYKRSYAHKDFVSDYHAFKGNAYGLANTLRQTAILKPKLKSKKVSNLYYAGQLTVPGPGVPPSLISGRVVAKEVNKAF